MGLPHDYAERVYAGVLGKIIGVYLGRPFEGWLHEQILKELGEIWYYVHDRLGKPLIVTDDDISGTFTFLRALPDHGYRQDITPAEIGHTWLNYLIEKRTILWWGGLGNSTEHTAYLRLKHGIEAPGSGSMAVNGKVVSEQIGAQIFIDGWAMVAPGDPALAADLARRAASVSHDGEAIYGAQVLAAMEAQAFVERNIDALLDVGVSFIPQDSVIYRMIADLRTWRQETADWREAFRRLAASYGYDRYGGNCHIVPNHGLIILSLLYGEDDFQRTLMIVNTCGWDTDCNSGNVGCLMGIKNGLAGINAGPDWRGPVADRLYLPTADGGRAVTDAVIEACHIVNVARRWAGEPPLAPKDGARFHFEFPGAVQGFRPEDPNLTRVENVTGHSTSGQHSLAIRYHHLAEGRAARVTTATFVPPEAIQMPGYGLIASPTLYPGQTVRASVMADEGNACPVVCALTLGHYGAQDNLVWRDGPEVTLAPGAVATLTWRVPELHGYPTTAVGVVVRGARGASGVLYLDYLTWDGTPDVVLTCPEAGGRLWRQAWVNGVDHFLSLPSEPYRLIQDEGTGLLIQGTREWRDYSVEADVTPHMAEAAGIAACVQGMRRYYALLLRKDSGVELVKMVHTPRVLAKTPLSWELGTTYQLKLEVHGTRLRGWVNGDLLFDQEDKDQPLLTGAVALVIQEGRAATRCVRVRPL